MTTTEKKYNFYVHGMHCQACVVLTESELKENSKVTSATSSLKDRSVEVCGNFSDASQEAVMAELNPLLTPHGYTLSLEAEKKVVNKKEFAIAIPIAIAFAIIFIILQKIGLVNLITSSNVTYSTAFVIGLIASLSTCLAVVGGLVLSMSATFAKNNEKVKPQILFHLGRLISFFILGGVIGTIGAVFQLGAIGTLVISLIIGVVMLLLGINLLDVFSFTKNLQPAMPKFLSQRALAVTKLNHTLTPALIGIVTFFLPCGFTQSMQIYTLSTGNFLTGGLTMLAFALGTLPVLALVSFSSFSIQKGSQSGIFFKSAGLIVIMFALFNLLNSLVAIGWISPFYNL